MRALEVALEREHIAVGTGLPNQYVLDPRAILGVGPTRRANLLDTTVCTYPFLLPWFIPTILAASLTASGSATGMPRLGAMQVGMANLHSWLLLSIVLIAVFGGYGRRSV